MQKSVGATVSTVRNKSDSNNWFIVKNLYISVFGVVQEINKTVPIVGIKA